MSPSSVPKWLADLGVTSGEWYINPKARTRRLMLNSLSAEARRVYACLELATMGFQQELAVTMENGKRRPLAPGDVARQTELTRQEVRAALAELEDQGLAKREADDGESLRRGHVRLYSWAVPHPTAAKIKDVAARDYNFPSWVPSSEPFRSLLRRWKVEISAEFVAERGLIEEGEAAARDYENAEIRARAFAERVCARPAHIRRKGTERNSERNTAAGGRSSVVESEPSASWESARPTTTTSASDLAEIRAALGGYGTADEDAASQMLRDCRAQAAECTASEICEFIAEKGRLARQNPIGFLLTAVPKCFAGEYKSTLAGNGARGAAVSRQSGRDPEFAAFMRSRVGDSLEQHRGVCGNPAATYEDWRADQERALKEWESRAGVKP